MKVFLIILLVILIDVLVDALVIWIIYRTHKDLERRITDEEYHEFKDWVENKNKKQLLND